MKLILLRHGQTQWNLAGKLQGWRDSSLTPQARRQLAALPARLLQNGIIYSSDLGRAQASARIVANISGSKIVTDKRLRERCFGVLQGKAIPAEQSDCPYWQAYLQRYQQPISDVPGVESESNLENRINNWLQEIILKHAQQTVLIISHGEWLRALSNILSGEVCWHQGTGVMDNATPQIKWLNDSKRVK